MRPLGKYNVYHSTPICKFLFLQPVPVVLSSLFISICIESIFSDFRFQNAAETL